MAGRGGVRGVMFTPDLVRDGVRDLGSQFSLRLIVKKKFEAKVWPGVVLRATLGGPPVYARDQKFPKL